MKNLTKQGWVVGIPLFVAAAMLVSAILVGSCAATKRATDNFNSRVACTDYCNKKYDCLNQDPTQGTRDACVNDCRNSIEDNCGNEHQAAANDKIEQCVDEGCVDFWTCMVFEAAPECFGFVSQD